MRLRVARKIAVRYKRECCELLALWRKLGHPSGRKVTGNYYWLRNAYNVIHKAERRGWLRAAFTDKLRRGPRLSPSDLCECWKTSPTITHPCRTVVHFLPRGESDGVNVWCLGCKKLRRLDLNLPARHVWEEAGTG